ncbi:YaaA family protein [Nakamurella deserti]|uniref:YaaA family protein n=1 Tax=Nakamurella deserti TaxID=2164074 RepID=UPI000DBE132F
MLILLPPSETKRTGGHGAPLDLAALAFPGLTPLRETLVDELVTLAADLPAARAALGVKPSLDTEIAANAALRTAPTLPALDRYTGVLYDHLGVATMTTVQRGRADARLVIGSALFGATRATDPLPAYRLSANAKLPGRGGLAARWKPLLAPALSTGELTLDLRSGAYAALGPVAGAVTVDVVTERPDGSRSVVSHFSKATKGVLARVLCQSRAELDSVGAVVRAARRGGLTVEHTGPTVLTVVTG